MGNETLSSKIIHQGLLKEGKLFYQCNQACNITEDKITFEVDKVTCKNCKRAGDKLIS